MKIQNESNYKIKSSNTSNTSNEWKTTVLDLVQAYFKNLIFVQNNKKYFNLRQVKLVETLSFHHKFV